MTAREVIRIGDPDDPRIADYRAVRERDLAGRGGAFIAEGEVVLRLLLGGAARARARSVLVAERRLEAALGLAGPGSEGVPVYVASQAVMDAIAGFHIHRGFLAIGERPPALAAETLLARAPARAVVLAAFGIGNHDNMGGLFRNAAAFGAHAVLLDEACCDPLYRKAIRVSVGASLTVPYARIGGGPAALETLASAGFAPLALTPHGGEPIGARPVPARAALLVGAEGPGLPPALIGACRALTIPMTGAWDSLNVATAAAVALFALQSGR